jgi:NAD+ diphosphatase
MLIESQDKDGKPICLLGRSANWPTGTYSTLAGFVEIGESLEDAVRRESYEEAGIRIGEVKYIAAQPWPFPSSIMLGFRAKALTTELKLDPNEIEDAQWFTLEQILQFGTWGDNMHSGYKMPRTDSIARYLIDLWISEQRTEI